MPIFEDVCAVEGCKEYANVNEMFYHHKPEHPPKCKACGSENKWVISTFGIVWAKPLGDYADTSKEYGDKQQAEGGHWVTRVRSSRLANGDPERVFLRTIQEQREYCREEGLVPPDEVGQVEIHRDGKQYSSRGLPGCWT